MEQFVSTDMSLYTDEAFGLKDKVQNCAAQHWPPPHLFCGEDVYYDSELPVNRK